MLATHLSTKGQKLISMYSAMADGGYETNTGEKIVDAYNDFELKKVRQFVSERFQENKIRTVLDYGCGGSNWIAPGFDGEKSAKDFFELKSVYRYEPARDLDERKRVDAVVCFDVLEHIFVSDVANILRDMFSYSKKLVIINVACYEARALLPNGENAHITVRNASWWKGMLDSISTEFPRVNVELICSPAYNQMVAFPTFSDRMRQKDEKFCIDY
ncbi:hypothetical protein N9Y91_08825 [Alphaproteobacteria bacterium]|jgi:hypothetical protein|nr:hypothetical protein [Alphaproteobacteria bacterium]